MRLWSTAGLLLALILAISAGWRSIRESRNYYAAGVYRMARSTHAGYALAGFVLSAVFGVSYFWSAFPVVPVLGVTALVAIFYFTSFLRGFSDEE